MALAQKTIASRVAGRRVAAPFRGVAPVMPRVAHLSSVAPSFVEMAAPRLAARMQRGAVVVKASKQSVGDLKKADLEGKRVFVRAGE